MRSRTGRWRARGRYLLPQAVLQRLALDFEIGVFEAVARRDRGDLAALESLASAYARAGRVRDALATDRRICALLPANPAARYNLACSLSLAGDVDAALDALARAIGLGFSDLKRVAKDPDLANARRDARFRGVVGR